MRVLHCTVAHITGGEADVSILVSLSTFVITMKLGIQDVATFQKVLCSSLPAPSPCPRQAEFSFLSPQIGLAVLELHSDGTKQYVLLGKAPFTQQDACDLLCY